MHQPSPVQTPWGPLGYITFKRTYARRINDHHSQLATEEFSDTVERVISACVDQLHVPLTLTEKNQLRFYFLKLKASLAGRFLWQLGSHTVDRLGLFSLQNCAFVVVDEPIRPFTWTFDALMLGSGVGYNIQRKNVDQLPAPLAIAIHRHDSKDADFIVPDNREGWVELLHRTLEAHFVTGQSFSYSVHCIRPKGAPIRSFGGVASGPEELVQGIHAINERINQRVGQKLRPIDCLDIMNIIGSIVVSGNVRRSAQIALGDADDQEFLQAKRWDLGPLPNWRSMSNNSVICDEITALPEEFWEGYRGKGEPYGLINLQLSREIGRLGETAYPDPRVQGYNPCGEQALENKETCALAEIFLPNIARREELRDVTLALYRIVKHSLALPCHHADTEEVVHRNMRMGIGITGYLQATAEQKSWLSSVYTELRAFDVQYSAKMGWPQSIKLTTCKPSGTLSLLAGVTPGVHPGFSQYFLRRIRVAANSPLIALCQEHGYDMERQRNFDGSEDPDTMVVAFPCSFPEGTILAHQLSAIDQLESVKALQSDWSDNAISCTVYYRKAELPSIQAWLRNNYRHSLKSVSFLLHQEHGFLQAPYEAISREDYEAYRQRTRPIVSMDLHQLTDESDIRDSFECETGACPTK